MIYCIIFCVLLMPKTISGCGRWRGKVEYKSLIPPCASLEQLTTDFLRTDPILSCALLLNIFLLLLFVQLYLELMWVLPRLLLLCGAQLRAEGCRCDGSPWCSWRMSR